MKTKSEFALALPFHQDLTRAPSLGGAYILLTRLPRTIRVRMRSGAVHALSSGKYLYCGSAYGPGGLRARLLRHARRDKRLHWHIDHLTGRGHVLGAWVIVGGNECDLVRRLSFLSPAALKFGCTDCRDGCASHLLRYDPAWGT